MIGARAMTLADLEAVEAIEEESFSTPWSHDAFVQELTKNPLARYRVLTDSDQVVAYGGYWQIVDEGHITNIAVKKACRGEGLGRRILADLMACARKENLARMTLEVRRSNARALALYKAFGFEIEGIRKGYYQPEGEDAFILWCDLEKVK